MRFHSRPLSRSAFLLALLTTIITPLTKAQTAPVRPTTASICDFYAVALFATNTSSSQLKFISTLFNTVFIGNFTSPSYFSPSAASILPSPPLAVGGIAKMTVYNGTVVNLLAYFDGGYASTNDGSGSGRGVVKFFLDDGGAAPLAKGLPSNGNVGSAQYQLVTRIYQYFGTLLGCSLQGGEDGVFPAYQKRLSQYELHRYMNLDAIQMGFFISQVLLAAQSIGFSISDLSIIESAINVNFNHRCSPPSMLVPASAGPQLQSICIAKSCPLDAMAVCAAYPDNGVALVPVVANASLVGNGTAGGGTPASSGVVIISRSLGASAASSSSSSGATFTGAAAAAVRDLGVVAAAVGFGGVLLRLAV